jgi:NTE family protein
MEDLTKGVNSTYLATKLANNQHLLVDNRYLLITKTEREMKRKKQQKIALVLSGGGFNCAFQLGALNYIQKHWKKVTGLSNPMKFDIIAGVSGGALNGALLAMNKLSLLNDLWVNQIGKKGVSEIYTSDIIDTSHKGEQMKLKINMDKLIRNLTPGVETKFTLLNKLGLIFSKRKRKEIIRELLKDLVGNVKLSLPNFKSIADNTPLKKKLEKYLNRDEIKNTTFISGFVSLNSGIYHSVLHHQYKSNTDFVNGVLASTAMPLIWSPVDNINFNSENGLIQSKNNVDGGIRNVSPLGDVIKLINQDKDSQYKVIVINTNSGVPKQKDFANKSIFDIAFRSLYEIVMTEVFNNDIGFFTKVNHIVKQASAWDHEITLFNEKNRQIKSFESIVINPRPDFDLGNPLVANEELISRRMAHGEKITKSVFKTNEKTI